MKHARSHLAARIFLSATLATGACRSGARNLEPDPAFVARLNATVRLVGSETTWVTRGDGYELIGRSKPDLAAVQPQLDGMAAAFRRVFPKDSLAPIVVTIRRVLPPDKPYTGAAPVPNSARGEVVEVVLPDPHAKPEEDKSGVSATIPGGLATLDVATRPIAAMRAWLSAHASSLTKTPASRTEADGESDDRRIPAWAQAMIPLLGADSLVDRFTTALAAHPENLYPLSSYVGMDRPPRLIAAGERVPEARGSGPTGRGGVGGGGMGGGGRGGGGRGGMGGGGRGGASRGGGGGVRGGESERTPSLRGSALFDAQSLVLGRFLVARDGYDFIGALVDSRILGRVADETIAQREKLDLDHLDAEWRRWLGLKAAAIAGPVR